MFSPTCACNPPSILHKRGHTCTYAHNMQAHIPQTYRSKPRLQAPCCAQLIILQPSVCVQSKTQHTATSAQHRVQTLHARPPPCLARRAGPRLDRTLPLDDTTTINFACSAGHLHYRTRRTSPLAPLPSSHHLGCTAPPRCDAADHHNSATARHVPSNNATIYSPPPRLPEPSPPSATTATSRHPYHAAARRCICLARIPSSDAAAERVASNSKATAAHSLCHRRAGRPAIECARAPCAHHPAKEPPFRGYKRTSDSPTLPRTSQLAPSLSLASQHHQSHPPPSSVLAQRKVALVDLPLQAVPARGEPEPSFPIHFCLPIPLDLETVVGIAVPAKRAVAVAMAAVDERDDAPVLFRARPSLYPLCFLYF
jgi:hypothetical protein